MGSSSSAKAATLYLYDRDNILKKHGNTTPSPEGFVGSFVGGLVTKLKEKKKLKEEGKQKDKKLTVTFSTVRINDDKHAGTFYEVSWVILDDKNNLTGKAIDKESFQYVSDECTRLGDVTLHKTLKEARTKAEAPSTNARDVGSGCTAVCGIPKEIRETMEKLVVTEEPEGEQKISESKGDEKVQEDCEVLGADDVAGRAVVDQVPVKRQTSTAVKKTTGIFFKYMKKKGVSNNIKVRELDTLLQGVLGEVYTNAVKALHMTNTTSRHRLLRKASNASTNNMDLDRLEAKISECAEIKKCESLFRRLAECCLTEMPAIETQEPCYWGNVAAVSGILLTGFLVYRLFGKCLRRPKRHEKEMSYDDPPETV